MQHKLIILNVLKSYSCNHSLIHRNRARHMVESQTEHFCHCPGHLFTKRWGVFSRDITNEATEMKVKIVIALKIERRFAPTGVQKP